MTEAPRERHPLIVWAWRLAHLDFVGVAFAALFFCLSLTPSLLPRDWLFQGLIGGLLAAIGYGLGVLVVWAVRRMTDRPLPQPTPAAWRTLAVLAAAATVVFLVLDAGWQRDGALYLARTRPQLDRLEGWVEGLRRLGIDGMTLLRGPQVRQEARTRR